MYRLALACCFTTILLSPSAYAQTRDPYPANWAGGSPITQPEAKLIHKALLLFEREGIDLTVYMRELNADSAVALRDLVRSTIDAVGDAGVLLWSMDGGTYRRPTKPPVITRSRADLLYTALALYTFSTEISASDEATITQLMRRFGKNGQHLITAPQ